MKLSRRTLFKLGLATGAAGLLTPVARPAAHLAVTALNDVDTRVAPPPGSVDDASHLNQTAIAELWNAPPDLAACETALRELLARAEATGQAVAAAGTRHTMGGQSIAAGGIALNLLPLSHMALQSDGLLRVGAGTRWSEVIPFLDQQGLSVAVMQSNNSFSVGGSLSANVHGWQHNHPPIAATVAWLRLMLADGTLLVCSREQHAELFRLALGGYGLFGVILEAGLRVVPNARYQPVVTRFPVEAYADQYAALVDARPDAGMAYGRLEIVPERFLQEALLTVFYEEPGEIPVLVSAGNEGLRRTVFRGSVGSDYGKQLRWQLEQWSGERAEQQPVSRNQLLNEGVEVYGNRNGERTEILHEYFVPRAQLASFIASLRALVPAHPADLLNVTIRNVLGDEDSVLRYAERELFGLVMLFNQGRTAADEDAMQRLTRELIESALAHGGRYYLPYRLHATPAQLRAAYPQLPEFFARKRHYDPRGRWQNAFFQTYSGVAMITSQ